MQPATASLLEDALANATAGLELFPVNPTTKAPLVEKAPASATTDLAQITEWWTRWPTALIGCRVPQDHLIVDVDIRHGGHLTWRNIAAHIPIPTTRIHRSGRGDNGGHVWFRLPDGFTGKLTTKGLTGYWPQGQDHLGLDLLQRHHRYTILPPSPHPATGQPYHWDTGSSPTSPIATIPLELLEHLIFTPAERPYLATSNGQDRPGDIYNHTANWNDILRPHGWQTVKGDGDSDGSMWRHPNATADSSASIKHGCLFVYTPNTPFDVTEPSAPHGYTRFNAYTILEHHGDHSAAARHLAGTPTPQAGSAFDHQPAPPDPDETPSSIFLGWDEALNHDTDSEDWLYPDILARGRSHVFYAKHKVGKSLLALYIATQLATSQDPNLVIYLDYEMSLADLVERLNTMGYETEDAHRLARLRYALFPPINPLDTQAGADQLIDIVDQETANHPNHHVLLILDTTSRAVQGEENDADTIRDLYRLTGLPLKQRGHTIVRLDHAGKDATKGQRGTSAKGDDVDVVWKIERTEDGIVLHREVARMAWVPEKVELQQTDWPLRYIPAPGGEKYPEHTRECCDDLDRLGVPRTAGRPTCRKALRDAGIGVADNVLNAAIRHRKNPANHWGIRP